MSKKNLMLRYRSAGHPVRVFVNGFLVVNDLEGESSGTRLEAYVQPGPNRVRIDARAALDAGVSVQVVLAPDDGGPGEVELMSLQHPEPGPRQLAPGVVEDAFEIPGGVTPWSWTQLQPVPPAAEPGLHPFVQGVARALALGPDAELLRLLNYKHAEVGAALGIGKAAMDQGLARGLAARRQAPDFRVEGVPVDELVPVWSPDRRIVRPMRRDGRDAILMTVGGVTAGFELSLGFHQNQWIVVR